MLLELSFLKASWITPFFFFFVKQSFYVPLLSGDRTSRYLGWDPVFHGLGSALSSWLTVSPDVISILTFLKSLYFPACILTCPTSWLCISDLFTYLALLPGKLPAVLWNLSGITLSLKTSFMLTSIPCYSSDRVAESVCVHILTGNVDLNALTWFIYGIVSCFKMEFCLNTRTASSLSFLIASSATFWLVTAVPALCCCDLLGPFFNCLTQFLLSDMGLSWGCCFQRPSYHSAPCTRWKWEWTKTPWGNDGSWRVNNAHVPYYLGRHQGLIRLGISKRLGLWSCSCPFEWLVQWRGFGSAQLPFFPCLNLPSPLLLFLGITSQGRWSCLRLRFWGEPKLRQSPHVKPASLCYTFLHWEMLGNYLQVSKSNP